MSVLLQDERLDDLNRNGLKIIQNPKKFCFGMDAVLLSAFAKAKRGDRVIDLGTGNGIIPILMSAKTEAEHFTGLEIQSYSASMAARSVRLNHLDGRISIKEGDIKEASQIFGTASFDVVTSNPPYMKSSGGLKNPDSTKAIARHEIMCTLEDVIREASALLKEHGHFYMVHRPARLAEIIDVMRQYRLEPKNMKLVHPFIDHDANMVLIHGQKGGGVQLTVEKPLIVYESQGKYTDEIYDIYGY